MSIQVAQALFDNTGTDKSQKLLLWLKTSLVTLGGWTVSGSRVGAGVGNMTGTDLILATTDLVQDSWYVLRSPHASAGDRIQILFEKVFAGGGFGRVSYCPQADYTGGVAGIPTSTSGTAFQITTWSITGGSNLRTTLLVDDEPPYGWAMLGSEQLAPDNTWSGMALIPIENQPASAGKPYVLHHGGNFNNIAFEYNHLSLSNQTAVAVPGSAAQFSGVQPRPAGFARALFLTTDGGPGNRVFPSAAAQDINSHDVRVPIVWTAGGTTGIGEYFGTSTFMQWNGTDRPNLSVLNNRERIIFGHVSLPWDGVTLPQI